MVESLRKTHTHLFDAESLLGMIHPSTHRSFTHPPSARSYCVSVCIRLMLGTLLAATVTQFSSVDVAVDFEDSKNEEDKELSSVEQLVNGMFFEYAAVSMMWHSLSHKHTTREESLMLRRRPCDCFPLVC